jgi:hypothetical protein
MAGGGRHGEWSTHIRLYEFEWLYSELGLDFDDFLLVLGLDTCSAYGVVFCIPINEKS